MADKRTTGAVEDAIEAAKYEARQEGYAEGLRDGVAQERERCLEIAQENAHYVANAIRKAKP